MGVDDEADRLAERPSADDRIGLALADAANARNSGWPCRILNTDAMAGLSIPLSPELEWNDSIRAS
ncbi:hypothetical protein [Mesorhizobium sp. M0847]|uniref:hypothetical protein n=1 Tax=unclassified Mesorhizobium TaxID=325217 RepID=UPI003335C31F